ncbi:MAG: flavin reductase [Anaerolinea sp.]|nr:flavin reductase [Anaerolinea sp.]
MTIDEKTFRQAMRFWSTGVTVVTSIHEGIQRGLTVSSFTSVSASPPVVLVSINRFSRTHQIIKESGVFAVTILEKSQQAVSAKFAGQVPEEEDRFKGLEIFVLKTGAPIIAGGVACFDCKLVNTFEIGDNTIFFGEVMDAQYHENLQPLLYSNRSYQSLKE